MFISAPLLIGVTSMTFFVKVDALPKLAAGIMVFTNAVNVISKIIYMGPLKLGIEGAAYGTITGYVAGFLLLIPYLFFRKKRTLLFVPLSVKDFRHLGNIIITGLPSSLGQGLGAITTFFINVVFMDVAGKSGIVLHTVCTSMTIFISSFRYAAASAMVPIVGALFGERDWWSMHQVAVRTTKIVMGFVAASIILFEIFPAKLLAFFGVHDMGIIAMGVPALRIYAISLFLGSFTHILMTYMQTTGRKIFSIAISAGNEIFSVIQTAMEIIEMEKNPKKNIDIMALVYDGRVKIRLRDDGKAPETIKIGQDDRISRLSVMGYNNTYIQVPI